MNPSTPHRRFVGLSVAIASAPLLGARTGSQSASAPSTSASGPKGMMGVISHVKAGNP